MRLIAEIDYNDGDRCARYGPCDWYAGDGFNANFREALFVQKLECPANACSADTITVHAEDLGQGKLALACRRLEHHGRGFHSMVDTDCEPVPGDANRHLEVFVFNDGRSCEDLESAAFGRDPDSCSGIYWEGDPSNRQTDRVVDIRVRRDRLQGAVEVGRRGFRHRGAAHHRRRNTTSQTISGLLAGTEYAVRVVATKNGLEDGPPSDPAKGTPTPATAELSARGDSIRIDLPPRFGATGEAWTCRATSNAPTLTTATLNGTTLVIAANEQGESRVATVTVTATGPGGSTRQQVIVVTIEPGASTWLRGWRRAVLEKRRGEGG